MAWTSPELVQEALGPSVTVIDDAYLQRCCDAASVAAYDKRAAAGYVDDPDPDLVPSSRVEMGTTLWAVALWRERVSIEGFASFEALSTFTPTGGSWGTIRRLLGIGRAQVDTPLDELAGAVTARRRLFRYRPVLR